MEKNILSTDYLTLSVKKSNLTDIISYYTTFGWTVLNTTPDKQYENIVELKLSRPHTINNKDELQYTQISMESVLYKKSRLMKRKHSKSLIYCLTLSLLFLIISALATNLFNLYRVWSIICFCFSGLMLISTPILTILLFKKETKYFNFQNKLLEKELNQHLLFAKKLFNGEVKDNE